MGARLNRSFDSFTRGLVLGGMHASGCRITTELVRRVFGVSRATAKRDLVAMRRQGLALPKRPE